MRGLAAHDLLPREGNDIELVPRQILREGGARGVANGQALAIRRDHLARNHAHARGRAVPCEDNVVVIVERREIDDLAIISRVDRSGNLELLDHIGRPTGAEALPGGDLDGALAKKRPERHLDRAGIRGRNDADAVIGGDAEDLGG